MRCRSGPTGLFGIKAHWSQFAPYEASPLLDSLGGFECAIWIWRRDLLSQAISYVRAVQTGQWISGAPQKGEAYYDYGEIVEKATRIRDQNTAWQAFFSDRFERPVLRVPYEDLLAAQDRFFGEIGAFLEPKTLSRPVASERTQKVSGPASSDWRQRFLADLRDEDQWILEAQKWGPS